MLASRSLNLPSTSPLLTQLQDELHSRSFPKLQGPVTVSQVTVIHDKDDSINLQRAHLARLATMFGVDGPDTHTHCYYRDLGELDIRWEHHTEFSTYTVLRLNQEEPPFAATAWSRLPAHWCADIPGQLLSATHIHLQAKQPGPVTWPSQSQPLQTLPPNAACRSMQDKAHLWANFESGPDGFDHLLVIDRGLSVLEQGRLLRSLLELSSYRMMVLLAVPVNKLLLPRVNDMETQLASLTLHLSKTTKLARKKHLLHQLSELSAKLERSIADHQFRFEASQAYLDIVHSRLQELGESELSGMSTLSDFLNRRLAPAAKTSASLKQRMLNISARIEKASDLLRTQINLVLEEQNQALLQALNHRSELQLRLQQLIEGVSTLAISYYLLQMLDHTLVWPLQWPSALNRLNTLNKDEWLAIAVLPITLSVWWGLRRARKRLRPNDRRG